MRIELFFADYFPFPVVNTICVIDFIISWETSLHLCMFAEVEKMPTKEEGSRFFLLKIEVFDKLVR